jgi:transaldolase
MTTANEMVFLLDVDNTLLDNNRVIADLNDHLAHEFGDESRDRYWKIFEALRVELADAGARPQRLLCASTGTKDPDAPDTLYIEALAAQATINTIPEKTLLAFVEHGDLKSTLPPDGGDAEAVLAEFAQAGVDTAKLASELQRQGAQSFAKSWSELMARIASQGDALTKIDPP